MATREQIPEHIIEGFRQEWRDKQAARVAEAKRLEASQMYDALGISQAVDISQERQATKLAASTHAASLAAAIAKQREQRLARQQGRPRAQVASNSAPMQSRRPPQLRQAAPTQASIKCGRNELAQQEVQHVAQRNNELREEVMRLERAREAQCKLDALHEAALRKEPGVARVHLPRDDPVSRLAQINAMRAARLEQLKEKEREAHRKSVDARTPSWWPREVHVAPKQQLPPRPRRPPSDPEIVAAANKRLDQIRLRLEEGQRLTPEEESDAAAIMELRRVWAARACSDARN